MRVFLSTGSRSARASADMHSQGDESLLVALCFWAAFFDRLNKKGLCSSNCFRGKIPRQFFSSFGSLGIGDDFLSGLESDFCGASQNGSSLADRLDSTRALDFEFSSVFGHRDDFCFHDLEC